MVTCNWQAETSCCLVWHYLIWFLLKAQTLICYANERHDEGQRHLGKPCPSWITEVLGFLSHFCHHSGHLVQLLQQNRLRVAWVNWRSGAHLLEAVSCISVRSNYWEVLCIKPVLPSCKYSTSDNSICTACHFFLSTALCIFVRSSPVLLPLHRNI